MNLQIDEENISYELLNDELDNIDIDENDSSSSTPSISLYLNSIAKYPVLTFEEEQELAKKIENGDKLAREKFINSNLKLVVSIAKKYRTSNINFWDLIQEGNLALLRAVETFDYTKGFKFSTYATRCIKRAILSVIANNKNPIQIPYNVQMLINMYQSVQNNFYKNNGRAATDSEVSLEMQIPINKIKQIQSFIYSSVSLQTPISSEDELELVDIIKVPDLTPEEIIIKNSRNEALQALISNTNLTEIEETIIKMRFGFNHDKLTTLESIGKKLKKSKERIRMIESKALRKLRVTVSKKFNKDIFM